MTSHVETSPVEDTAQQRLPEFWPQQVPPEPVRPLWIPWPVAIALVPLLWLVPKRVGPHFAAVRWPGVIIAHLVWTIYGIGCIAVAYWTPTFGWVAYVLGRVPGQQLGSVWPPPAFSDIVRAPLAMLASLLAGQPLMGIAPLIATPADLVLKPAIVVGVEAGLVILACLLMPYATAGEHGRRLFARCVKLTLLASISLPVLGLAFQGIELINRDRRDLDSLWELAIVIYLVWFTWIWIRSGLRYAGPAEGPGWEPRRPLCEACGYTLTGLKPADNCPECGTAIALSMPGRRQPTAFASASGLRGSVVAFVRTWRAALRRDFHKNLAIHSEYEPARRFAILICILAGLSPSPVVLADAGFEGLGKLSLRYWIEITAVGIGISLSALLLLGLLTLTSRVSGLRSLRSAASIVFYWSAWFVVIAVATGASVPVLYVLRNVPRPDKSIRWIPGEWVDWGAILCTVVAAGGLIVFIIAAVSLARAIRRTRFANA